MSRAGKVPRPASGWCDEHAVAVCTHRSLERCLRGRLSGARSLLPHDMSFALPIWTGTEFQGCQSDPSDPRNRMGGEVGSSCMGITPAVGWQARFFYPNCVDDQQCRSAPHLFTKCCHDKDPDLFRTNTVNVYVTKRIGPAGCADLTWPAFFVCADVSMYQGYIVTMQLLDALPFCKNSALEGDCEPGRHCTLLNELLARAVNADQDPEFQPFKAGRVYRGVAAALCCSLACPRFSCHFRY